MLTGKIQIMQFIEGLLSALTVALVMGLPVFWYKDQAMFHAIGRVLLIVVSTIFFGAMLVSVGYMFGTLNEHARNSKFINTIQHQVEAVRISEIRAGAIASDGEEAVIKAVPDSLPLPTFRDSIGIIPIWFWVCFGMLNLELVLLTGMTYTRGPASANSKADAHHE